jgi:hypothetical protein
VKQRIPGRNLLVERDEGVQTCRLEMRGLVEDAVLEYRLGCHARYRARGATSKSLALPAEHGGSQRWKESLCRRDKLVADGKPKCYPDWEPSTMGRSAHRQR